MNIINLSALKPVQASTNLASYTMLLYGVPKIGKTTFVRDLYGKRVLFIATEKRHKALVGAYVIYVGSWTEYLTVLAQLNQPDMKDKFDVIAIDTVENLFQYLEDYIMASFNETEMGNVEWGKDWTEEKKQWKKGLKQIEQMGYSPCFISHSIKSIDTIPASAILPTDVDESIMTLKDKKIKDEKTGRKQVQKVYEFEKYTPDLPKRAMGEINKMVDNILFMNMTTDDQLNEHRVIHLRETLQWVAGSTFDGIKPIIPLDAEAYKQAVTDSLNLIPEEFLKEEKEEFGEVDQLGLNFNELMNEAKQYAVVIANAGKVDLLNRIASESFGEGNKLLDAQPHQVEPLYVAVQKLRVEAEKIQALETQKVA